MIFTRAVIKNIKYLEHGSLKIMVCNPMSIEKTTNYILLKNNYQIKYIKKLTTFWKNNTKFYFSKFRNIFCNLNENKDILYK